MQKVSSPKLQTIEPDNIPFTEGDGLRKWRSFRNAYTTMKLLQNPCTKRLNSPDDVTISGARTPPKQYKFRSESSKNFDDALLNLQIQIKLFNAIQTGQSAKDIEHIVQKDPKRYFYDKHAPNSLVNKKNSKGITPLYLAAQLGHSEICNKLLELGADPQISVKIQGVEDTPFEVAKRWKHLKVLNLFKKYN